MHAGISRGRNLAGSSPVAGNQPVEVIAVRSVRAESFFIEEALDATPEADLIGAILEANRPAHSAVPAAAKNYDSRRSQPSGNHTQRPHPTRLLFLVTHDLQPLSRSKD